MNLSFIVLKWASLESDGSFRFRFRFLNADDDGDDDDDDDNWAPRCLLDSAATSEEGDDEDEWIAVSSVDASLFELLETRHVNLSPSRICMLLESRNLYNSFGFEAEK